MEISQVILNLMESKGITAYKVAQATGISQGNFYNWKKKPTSKITLENVQKIADVLGVPVSEITGEDEKQGKKNTLPETQGVQSLYKNLVNAGILKDGEDLSVAQREALFEFIEKNKNYISARADELKQGKE